MIKYFPFLIILFSTTIFAQSNTTCSGETATTPLPMPFGVNITSGTVNGKPTKIMQIIFDGNIEVFINKMKLALGNGNIKTEGEIINSIIFKKFKEPDWSENEIILTFNSVSNSNRNYITITCFDSKGNDLLEFDSLSNMKIKTYFESILPK